MNFTNKHVILIILTIIIIAFVFSYDVYINNNYYGSNPNMIQINNGDMLKFDITKNDSSDESTITLISKVI